MAGLQAWHLAKVEKLGWMVMAKAKGYDFKEASYKKFMLRSPSIGDFEGELKKFLSLEEIKKPYYFILYNSSKVLVIYHLFLEFAFILYDFIKAEFFIARDPYGVRPLYIANVNTQYCFASDLEPMLECIIPWTIEQFTPGTYMILNTENKNVTKRHYGIENTNGEKDYVKGLYDCFCSAVYKRVINTERPIACLLSGGLDSSLVAALASRYCKKRGQQLETYSIGLEASEDLKYAFHPS
jgi:asparagine synthetase B (glutamine-hydrolysing)